MAFQRNIGDALEESKETFDPELPFKTLESELKHSFPKLNIHWVFRNQRGVWELKRAKHPGFQRVALGDSEETWLDLLSQPQAEILSGNRFEVFASLGIYNGHTFTLALEPESANFGLVFHHPQRDLLEQVARLVANWPFVWQAGRNAAPLMALVNRHSGKATRATAWLEACESKPMRAVVDQAKRVAKTHTAVLISGETGTGKGVLARALHAWSKRSGETFVSVNCATLKPELIESELFGHVRGAFTGAEVDRSGRFQAAHEGTLFLDEVGELPQALQAKLLRVLQEGQFEPLGSNQTTRVDVRLIAATNRDLESAVRQGEFREDLYYRLAVFPMNLPPLRERPQDLPAIAQNLFDDWLTEGLFHWKPELKKPDFENLQSRSWPGNIRQLSNFLKRAMVLAEEPKHWHLPVSPEVTPFGADQPIFGELQTLEAVEKAHITAVLHQTKGKLYGARGAAKRLGLHPSTLRGRMRKLGLGGSKQFKPKSNS